MSAAAFRQLLEEGDVAGLRAAWAEIYPDLPQPETRDQAEIVMHMTRTSTTSVALRFRAYSHRWLCERNLPSQLPDQLKPEAERLYPRVFDAVGISLNTKSDYLRPALLEARGAMEYAVEDCYANGDTDPAIVRPRMAEAKERTLQALFGKR